MNIAVLMGAFFVLLFLGVPIAYSLCLSAVLYMALFMDVPMIIIGQQMLKGVDSFTLMAIPFFVIAGGLMESGGISKRIVNFARTVVGHLPGTYNIKKHHKTYNHKTQQKTTAGRSNSSCRQSFAHTRFNYISCLKP